MVNMKHQIASSLRQHQLTAKEIAENIGENYKTVFGHLTRMREANFVEQLDDKTYVLTDLGVSQLTNAEPTVKKIKVPAERLPPQPKTVEEIMKQPVKLIEVTEKFEPMESLETRAIKPNNEKTVEEINRTVNYNNNVNSPPHYNSGDIECIDAIKASMSKDAFLGYCKGNVLKYMWRYEQKGYVESLEKAQWYLKKMIESML